MARFNWLSGYSRALFSTYFQLSKPIWPVPKFTRRRLVHTRQVLKESLQGKFVWLPTYCPLPRQADKPSSVVSRLANSSAQSLHSHPFHFHSGEFLDHSFRGAPVLKHLVYLGIAPPMPPPCCGFFSTKVHKHHGKHFDPAKINKKSSQKVKPSSWQKRDVQIE